MKLKNIIIGIFFSVISFTFVSVANAVNWEPLVPIPGIPATGVNLSTYLIGIYNFLLSIVGIVAVMMLIVGGIRYITSAGNQAAAADAKDIITNAIVGLLLALLTWVFIATINPDALYLKKPGSTFAPTPIVGQGPGACFDNFVLPDICTCGDGAVITSSNVNDCVSDCRAQDHCVIPPGACVRKGAVFFDKSFDGKCYCVDGKGDGVNEDGEKYVTPVIDGVLPDPANCDEVCSDDTGLFASDGLYHGVEFNLKAGEFVGSLKSGSRFTVTQGKTAYFDVTGIKDCLGKETHIVLDFDGGPGAGIIPDRVCCNPTKPAGGCGLLEWGNSCYLGLGIANCNEQSIGIIIPFFGLTSTGNDMHPDPRTIWKHTFGAVSPANDPEYVWVGVSRQRAPGDCPDYEKSFQIDVVVP